MLGALLGCGTDPPAERPRVFGGDRPVELVAPDELEAGRRYPLLLVLHGYGFNGFGQTAYFGVNGLPAAGELLLLAPEGTTNREGRQFWNADPACCDFYGDAPDDVGYLGGVLEDVIAAWPIDPARVYAIGHSNGGFMAYRLACERADLLAAVMALAGNTSTPAAACAPARAVDMLLVHGTDDDVVPYDGSVPPRPPLTAMTAGAVGAATRWAAYNGCGATRSPGAPLDLEAGLAGAETTVERADGCADATAELWTITGGSHAPSWTASFAPALVQWLTGR